MPAPAPEKAQAKYKYWMDEIEAAKKVFADYFKQGKKIVKVYKDDRKRTDGDDYRRNNTHKLNILWSNIQTLQPALYSRTPEPNASRRFLDRDPVSRIGAQIIERNLETAIEICDLDYNLKRVRDDYLLVARGTNWVRFDPVIVKQPMKEPVTRIDLGNGRNVIRPVRGGEEIPANKVKKDEDGLEYYETDPEEQILSYGLAIDHVLWSDFLHEPLADWSKVGWAAKRVLMKRAKLVKFFGEEVGMKVKLNKTFTGRDADEFSSDNRKKADCAEVWEIWSKEERKVCWISNGYVEAPLKELDDPLRLSGFWPFPRPLYGTLTTDSSIPVPDYVLYQDQAEQIDRMTDRIRLLIQALRVVGLYNAESADLSQLLGEADENEMLPVSNWMAFAQAGGMKGNIDWLPIEQIQNVLTGLFQARAQLKQDLYEITGISDIIRGATNANETATAQQIKSNFGNLRLQDRQMEMARFARDTLMIMAEIQCEHYSPEALIEMSGIAQTDELKPDPANPQVTQERQQKLMAAVQLVKSDKMRTYRIDVETDATVAPDQQREKEARVEFLTAVAPFLEKSAQVGMAAPQLVPLLMKMLEFGVRGFRTGRTLESAIEETIALAEQMQQQQQAAGPQAPPPDPAAEAMAQKLQAETQKLQGELERLKLEIEQDKQKHAAEMAAMQQEAAAKLQDINRRSEEARLKFQQDMLKLTEEIAFRRTEHDQKMKEVSLNIQTKQAQAKQSEEADNMRNLKDVLSQHESVQSLKEELNELRAAHGDLTKKTQDYDKLIEALGGLGQTAA